VARPVVVSPTLRAEPISIDQLSALVDSLRDDAPKQALERMTDVVSALRKEQQDQVALMKRDWSDTAFEEGEAGNEKILEGFEVKLVGMLQGSPEGLGESGILGSSIDLAGAYKKNYKLEKAEAVLLRCTRNAEERSGAWMVKYLNHLSQVRMKQSREVEAMEMMYEMESLATFTIDEVGASEFFETLFRNMTSSLRRMNREDEAAIYFMKMVDAAKRHKPALDWMDLWDLGILIANRAYQSESWDAFYQSRNILAEALRQQHQVEPHELVLRAKVLSNLGQCFLATGEYAEAEVHYSEAYILFSSTVGKRSPLFGMQAWACGNLRCAEGRYREALPYLGEALYVEVTKDGLSVSEMLKLVDQIMVSIHHLQERSAEDANLNPLQRSLTNLLEDRRWWQLGDSLELAALSHKIAVVFVSLRWTSGELRDLATRYNERAVEILRRLSDPEARSLLLQAQAIQSAILVPRSLGPTR